MSRGSLPKLSLSQRVSALFGLLSGALVLEALIATGGGTGLFHTDAFGGLLLIAWGELPIVVAYFLLRSVAAAFVAGSVSTALVAGSFWTLLTSEHSTAPLNAIAPILALMAIGLIALIDVAIRWVWHHIQR